MSEPRDICNAIRRGNWRENCDYTYSKPCCRYLLGEDENGDLFVPTRWAHPEDAYRPFSPRRPLHWLAYVNSRMRRQIAPLERIGGER